MSDVGNVVKVVFANDRALYFSRSAIPFTRDIELSQALNQGVFYKHIGIYAYRFDVLLESVFSICYIADKSTNLILRLTILRKGHLLGSERRNIFLNRL